MNWMGFLLAPVHLDARKKEGRSSSASDGEEREREKEKERNKERERERERARKRKNQKEGLLITGALLALRSVSSPFPPSFFSLPLSLISLSLSLFQITVVLLFLLPSSCIRCVIKSSLSLNVSPSPSQVLSFSVFLSLSSHWIVHPSIHSFNAIDTAITTNTLFSLPLLLFNNSLSLSFFLTCLLLVLSLSLSSYSIFFSPSFQPVFLSLSFRFESD